VKMKGNQDFMGRAALEEKQSKPLSKMLVGFTTEREDVVLLGRETILRDGKFAGYLTSGGYGYTLQKPIGLGYVRNADGVSEDYVMKANYELVVAQERVKATPHLKPMYDPQNLKVKG
jgi:sarcosine dehydrogenase